MTLTRRTLSLGILALAACQIPPPSQRAVMIADAQAVVAGVTAAYAAMSEIPSVRIPLNVDAQVRSAIASATALASGLPRAVDAAAAASDAQGAVSAISAVLNLVAPIIAGNPNVPPPVMLTLQAATRVCDLDAVRE